MKEHLLFNGIPEEVASVVYWRAKAYENIYALGSCGVLVAYGLESLREIRNYMRVCYRLEKPHPRYTTKYIIHRSGKLEKAHYDFPF